METATETRKQGAAGADSRKVMILDALDAFVRQRSGMDYRNYYQNWTDKAGIAAFRAEQRSIARDLRDYRELRRAVELRDSITANDLGAAFSNAFSGRLVLRELAPVGSADVFVPGYALDYCTGQYFPTEYRKAACAVLASALWARKRTELPKPELLGSYWTYAGKSAGDWLRASFRKEFGRGVASRWFS